MATQTKRPTESAAQSSDARWLAFAGAYMMVAGLLNLIWGVTALAKKEHFVEGGLVFSSLGAWGWIAILIAIVQIGAGALVYANRFGGMLLAVLISMCALLMNFLTVGAYPLWSCVAIVANALVLWAVTVHSASFQ